ncbi:MAG: sigma-70 family RNA polymerase sigma factor [Verrucomicrobiota bacterium]
MPEADRHDEFMQLFLEHQPRIYGYVRSLLFQKADADDVMQETASVLWRKFDEYEKGTHFDRWAFRVAFHQVRAFRQKRARESKRIQFSDDVLDLLSEDVKPLLDSTEEMAAALERCLRKLPSQDRKMIAWRFDEGGTNRKVAQRIGKSESVVSRHLSKVYESLMRCISLQLKFDGQVG